jgi:hypothetical protein
MLRQTSSSPRLSSQFLFASEIVLGRLNRCVPKQKLNLLKFAASQMVGRAQVRRKSCGARFLMSSRFAGVRIRFLRPRRFRTISSAVVRYPTSDEKIYRPVLRLNNISFGISVDIGSFLRSRPQHQDALVMRTRLRWSDSIDLRDRQRQGSFRAATGKAQDAFVHFLLGPLMNHVAIPSCTARMPS